MKFLTLNKSNTTCDIKLGIGKRDSFLTSYKMVSLTQVSGIFVRDQFEILLFSYSYVLVSLLYILTILIFSLILIPSAQIEKEEPEYAAAKKQLEENMQCIKLLQ